MDHEKRTHVAVVGSGMAGLVTAFLLNQDFQSRYAVTLFESGTELALDSSSVSVTSPTTCCTDRVDLPMRAFAGGFYHQLKLMYEYLGVEYHAQPFLFSFSKVIVHWTGLAQKTEHSQYFVHSSNNHRIPPLRPNNVPTSRWMLEVLYVLGCYMWFTVCCFFIQPQSAGARRYCESLEEYLQRIKLSQYFVTYYLLPMISSVATCSHDALMNFPASDVINYKRLTQAKQHYTVSHGVQEVQSKLAKGIDVRLSARVSKVEPLVAAVRINWVKQDSPNPSTTHTETFDQVVLATSPDVIGRIFMPLEAHMAQIPTTSVKSILHTDTNSLREGWKQPQETQAADSSDLVNQSVVQMIHFQTSTEGTHKTEAIHIQPSGVLVTTCPFSSIDPAQIITSSTFTRVLRTPRSRSIVNEIFGRSQPLPRLDVEKPRSVWRNGDGGVWLVGGWCWDGMVLLEGCVVSAMRVAEEFDVQIPWKIDE